MREPATNRKTSAPAQPDAANPSGKTAQASESGPSKDSLMQQVHEVLRQEAEFREKTRRTTAEAEAERDKAIEAEPVLTEKSRPAVVVPKRRRPRFDYILFLLSAAFAAAAVIYHYDDELAEWSPNLVPWLEIYVDWVNNLKEKDIGS